ncbi:hypothetical protein [Polaromonas sp. YR568]|jgi:hypothetical protein|uniref:hypothetical protein n=1 Tax=Polaromonas sp. YR568 TaxID=1855301 RepID=UPI003137D74D
MKTSSQVVGAATMAALFLMGSAWAQNAPGEDPVILTKRIAVQMAPIGGARPSSPMESMTSLPAWMKAKVARYEAKANSDQTNGISTDADAVRSASSDGFKKTCIQEVGSTTTASSATGARQNGFSSNQQIVVLKGDLVNICN